MNDEILKLTEKFYAGYTKDIRMLSCSAGLCGPNEKVTNNHVKALIEKCFNICLENAKNSPAFKALGAWQQTNVVNFNNLALPHEFADVFSVKYVTVGFLMKEKHFTILVAIEHSTGITGFYETNISTV